MHASYRYSLKLIVWGLFFTSGVAVAQNTGVYLGTETGAPPSSGYGIYYNNGNAGSYYGKGLPSISGISKNMDKESPTATPARKSATSIQDPGKRPPGFNSGADKEKQAADVKNGKIDSLNSNPEIIEKGALGKVTSTIKAAANSKELVPAEKEKDASKKKEEKTIYIPKVTADIEATSPIGSRLDSGIVGNAITPINPLAHAPVNRNTSKATDTGATINKQPVKTATKPFNTAEITKKNPAMASALANVPASLLANPIFQENLKKATGTNN
ncbi:MAG: hypothetical protein ACOYK8_08885 [Alphaproteobacteria bacterium]